MAVGDKADGAGYPLVPNEGTDGRVRFGAREINRTRDFVAEVKEDVEDVRSDVPSSKSQFRIRSGITSGTAAPSGGANGDIYLRIM